MEAMMAQDKVQARGQGNFSLDDPTQALTHDHNYLRQLMQHYLTTQDKQVKQQAGPQICEALQIHTTLEEAVFYPRVQALDPVLVEKCLDDHQEIDELLMQLQELQSGEEAYDDLMQQLHDAVISHIEVEEQQLFPAVRNSALDLQDLALRMQAYESNLISTQAASSKGAEPGSPLH
jgi:hemerythrin superfamily protein